MARQLLREEGPSAFFKGVRARMTAHAPAVAISWGTYELIKKSLVETWGGKAGGKGDSERAGR